MYPNSTTAFVDGLRAILDFGEVIDVRGREVKEVRARIYQIASPAQRTYVLPHRNNSVFGTIAETIWVLAGRNDIGYLSRYLSRASKFSDDGATWRAGYGPRLRAWSGIDQIAEVRRLLLADPASRRAVVGLFDPAVDFQESKDVPCNNWLQFMIRDGKLDMLATIRSNDAVWGFSGINTFEWSVLQEMVAHWTGTEVGTFTYFIGSFHLYKHHYSRARRIVNAFGGRTPYDFEVPTLTFGTPFDRLDLTLRRWFEIEQAMREGRETSDQIADFPDPFLRGCLGMLRIYNRHLDGAPSNELAELILQMPESDFRVAAAEYFLRDDETFPLDRMSAREQEFFSYFVADHEKDMAAIRPLLALLSVLHDKKTRVYQDAWKKRGETLGIIANIARKYDRLDVAATGGAFHKLADEGQMDTLADLATYAAKYLTFLADTDPVGTIAFMARYRPTEPIDRYQGNYGFDDVGEVLALRYDQDRTLKAIQTQAECFLRVQEAYAIVERLAREGGATETKCEVIADLALSALHYMMLLALEAPGPSAAFKSSIERL